LLFKKSYFHLNECEETRKGKMGRRRRRNRHPRRYCTIDFLKCEGYTKQGKGIVTFKGKPFHVDELIKGEEARILVYYEEDNFGTARAIQLKKPSKDRVLPLGHWKFSIGSYQIPHLSDKAQDEFKNNRVRKYFPNAKDIIVGQRSYYRNKLSLTNGGFMAPGRGRKVSVVPEKFDLMDIDLSKYKSEGVLIIRKLDTTIAAKPGTKIFTTTTMLGKKFRVSLDSFWQVNTEMATLAYKAIIDEVDKGSIVLDLFGGAAVIGILVSDKAKQVYSVELNKDTHNDALKNIELNKIKNVKAIYGDANTYALENINNADTIIVDPARAGLSEASAKAINNSGAQKIIYLSCNIDTQFRDIKLMDKYEVKNVQPYDFFPQTFHIENLVILEKR